MKTFDFVGLVALVAGLMLSQGCRTTYSEQASAEDLSLRPMPESLTPEATGDVAPLEEPEAKQVPYWKQVQQQGGADADPYADAIGADPKAPGTAPGGVAFTPYTIKKNDTISHIALRYGLRWQDIAAVNSGLNIDKIRVGQVIRLPGAVDLSKARPARKSQVSSAGSGNGTVYIVKRNDILGRIARAHGVRISDIKKANGLKSDFIREGQKLVIPAKGAAVKAPAAKPAAESGKPALRPAPAPSRAPVAPKADGAVPPDESLGANPLDIPAPVVAPAAKGPDPFGTLPQPPAPAVKPASGAKAPARPGGTFSYRVLEGEDLYEVGIHWGVTTEEIRRLNPGGVIGEGGKLVPGTVLQIPEGAVAQ